MVTITSWDDMHPQYPKHVYRTTTFGVRIAPLESHEAYKTVIDCNNFWALIEPASAGVRIVGVKEGSKPKNGRDLLPLTDMPREVQDFFFHENVTYNDVLACKRLTRYRNTNLFRAASIYFSRKVPANGVSISASVEGTDFTPSTKLFYPFTLDQLNNAVFRVNDEADDFYIDNMLEDEVHNYY
jgi:hypothetical protein